MAKSYRRRGFRLGQLHGKLQAENRRSEAHIQRTVFLSQKVRVWLKRDKVIDIRIFGYEMPLEVGRSRGQCVDLIGYDKEDNLYLIELKKKESGEKIPDIIEQIDRYGKMVKKILPFIEKEFREEFFLPIRFNKSIKKMILAPREFFASRKKQLTDNSVYYCHFRDKDINTRKPGKIINLILAKR